MLDVDLAVEDHRERRPASDLVKDYFQQPLLRTFRIFSITLSFCHLLKADSATHFVVDTI